ncbi:MAG TPA: GNAT family acetyltransferase [Rhizomicrobium sp.]|jgi:GNAT superfamily N-acetyltransferase|nr:GNAT family acetyltransferase [Rhizomicrobium sp.]
MSFEVAPYSQAHFAGVKALWEEVFPDDPPRNDAEISIASKATEHPELFLLALEEGRVIGSVMAGYDGHRGWLYRVAVAKTHRHGGVGAALIHGAEQLLWALGCVKINLQVLGTNADVAAFYQSLGYVVEDRVSMGKVAQDDPLDLRPLDSSRRS